MQVKASVETKTKWNELSESCIYEETIDIPDSEIEDLEPMQKEEIIDKYVMNWAIDNIHWRWEED